MSIPADTRFTDQWHLQNTVVGEYDLDVVKVWDNYTGKGVKVFVLDSGIDYTNSDLAPNYDQSADHDFENDTDDAAPIGSDDNHGTAVAGIIGAARNGTGVVGVAYDSTLIGYRLAANGFAFTVEAEALQMALAENADVVNMSNGMSYEFWNVDGGHAAFNTAVDALAEQGRDGLGTIIVKSAGNGRDDGHGITSVNSFLAGADTHMIIVAAVDRNGYVSNYSTPGAPVLISAFGTPGEVVTTDRVGAAGYSPDDVATNFNGTSSAAPMISGIASLMLEANSDLGWRDVQTILAYSARHVGSPVGGPVAGAEQSLWAFNGAGNWNGGGLHFNTDYGYGLVDALAAVRLAESWTVTSKSANEISAGKTLLNADTPVAIPDGDLAGTTYSGVLGKAIDVERVTVTVTFTAAATDDLELYIVGPDGLKHKLIDDVAEGNFQPFSGTYKFESQEFRGEDGEGKWKVQIVDDAAGNAMTVSDIKLQVFGSASTKNDTYVYTNEFSDFLDTHSKTLRDTDGGTDLLNAAAVSDAINVNLAKGTGRIDGVDVKIVHIEDIFGGDGNDHLTGSLAANDLSGGRGRDVLAGGKGGDSFVFHVIDDSLAGDRHDLIADFGTGDRIELSGIDTRQKGGDQAFSFIGRHGFDGKVAELDFRLTDKPGAKDDFTTVLADLDGDKHADFQIELAGLHTLKEGDFVL
jgi:subtilisin family serine protease